MNTIAVDFETYYDNDCTVKTLGNRAYCRYPDWDAYMVSVCDGSETWVGHPKDLNWEALRGRHLVAHNAFFDRTVYRRLVELGLAPAGLDERWECTSNLTAYLCGSVRSLADGVKHLFGASLSKDVRDQAKGKRWSEMVAEGWGESMKEYARRDAHFCHRIWAEHSHKWPQWERRLSDLTIRNCELGVRVDVERLGWYIQLLQTALFEAEKNLPWMEDGRAPTSTKGIAEQCRRDGIPTPPVKDEDEEAFDRWVSDYSPGRAWIPTVGAWRSLNKTLKRLQLIESRIDDDTETMDFGLKYMGAHCVTGDHEVLTKDGWVRMDAWDGGDIAQWDKHNHEVSFLPATQNKFCIDEPLVCVEESNIKARYTLGHTVPSFGSTRYGRFRTLKAGDLPLSGSHFIPVSGHLLSDGAITADQMRVLVAIQADGHFTKDGILQFCLRKLRKISRIKQLLDKVGIVWIEQEFKSSPKQKRIAVRRADLPTWVSKDRKIFGPWLLDSTVAARVAFCEEVLLWDGYFKSNTYYSSIKQNADWAATMVHLCGFAGNVLPKKQRGNRKLVYQVSIRYTDRAMLIKGRSSSEYRGPIEVFCPSTKTGFWLVRRDGVVHVTGNTGRWSGDAGFNIQNQRKQPILLRDDWSMVTDKYEVDRLLESAEAEGRELPEGIRAAIDERSLLIPRRGYSFGIADLSQIEPRVLNWLIKNEDLLEKIRGGLGIYEAFARSTGMWTEPEPLKKADKRKYALAKAEVLGLGYQCGVKRFVEVAWALARIRITEEESAIIVPQFRESNPGIVALWGQLDSAFKRSAGGNFEIGLPSGRTLTYRNVRATYRTEEDEETGEKKTRQVYTAEVGNRRVTLYGGKLTENLVQAAARDIFAQHLLSIEDAGMRPVFSVHDEVITEIPEGSGVEPIVEIMRKAPDWIPGIPLDAEAVVADRYLK